MFLLVLIKISLLISYVIGATFDIKGDDNDYQFIPWETIPHTAIIYDADSMEVAKIDIRDKFGRDNDDTYWIYTGLGLQFEINDDKYCCRCFFERDDIEHTFARIYSPALKLEPQIKDGFDDKFQNNLFDLITDLIKDLWKLEPDEQGSHKSKYVISFFRKRIIDISSFFSHVEIKIYPLDIEPVPGHKFGWLQRGRADRGIVDEISTDFGQLQYENIKIIPNQDGENAVDIIDAHDFRIFSRTSSEQKGWRLSEFLGSSDWDYFEHIDGLTWKREHYVDPKTTDELAFYQAFTLEFNDDGTYKGFLEGRIHFFPTSSISSHGPDDTGIYKSHQWLLGDCNMHATNAVLRGPFFKNREFQKFGTKKDFKWKTFGWGTRGSYIKVLGLAHGFSNTIIKRALNSVGCDYEEIDATSLDFVRDRKFIKYGKQTNGNLMFLGFIFQYDASRKSESGAHAIGWVYKAKGPDGNEGFWWVQSWNGFNRRWYNMANAYNRLNEWKEGTKKGFFLTLFAGTRIWKWSRLLAVYIKPDGEDLYIRTLNEKKKKIAWKLQKLKFGFANMANENMYDDDDYDEYNSDVNNEYNGLYEDDTYNDNEYDKLYEEDEFIDNVPFDYTLYSIYVIMLFLIMIYGMICLLFIFFGGYSLWIKKRDDNIE